MCKQAAIWDTNAFVDAYIAANGVGIKPATEEVKTMHPLRFLLTID
jgi:hypothetical protein